MRNKSDYNIMVECIKATFAKCLEYDNTMSQHDKGQLNFAAIITQMANDIDERIRGKGKRSRLYLDIVNG